MPERKKIDLLRALEVFIAAADTGSMTTAARQLKITQSAISQQLKLLESEMRVTLVDRDTRPLRLTAAGHALRHRASELLARADRLRSDVRQITAQPLPNLRIAMFGTLARTLAPALVKAVVQKQLPIETISILRGMAVQHARDLPRREVDIVISSNALDGCRRSGASRSDPRALPRDRAEGRIVAARQPARNGGTPAFDPLLGAHRNRPHGRAASAPSAPRYSTRPHLRRAGRPVRDDRHGTRLGDHRADPYRARGACRACPSIFARCRSPDLAAISFWSRGAASWAICRSRLSRCAGAFCKTNMCRACAR